VLRDNIRVAQIIVDGDAGVVDQDVELLNLFGRALDLRGVGDVER
jgi:hypothetical protein